MSKYNDLVSILDRLCEEAPSENVRYHVNASDVAEMEQARSRAFIHLLLKVKFGMIDFNDREVCVTDGPYDGGIDAYYIDKDNKRVYFIQSKFRNSSANFEQKEITYDELMSMDVERIMNGEEKDISGNNYNGKIKQLQRNVSGIADLARYDYRIIILANIRERIQSYLNRIVGKFFTEVYNFERVYNELVFPVVSGTFFEPKELTITLSVNKESSGSRIQYYPETNYGMCTVNVQFVPTQEIGRILYQYKNSILRYNPRSYLELNSVNVNSKIKESIVSKNNNEFALFNNGITMISDETAYSDTVGRKNTALLTLTNPQIINGGQTAFTLSRIYEDAISKHDMSVFEKKEVLLKVISFNSEENTTSSQQQDKLALIEEISTATNQQTPVHEADRRANDKVQVELQTLIYEDFGLYYERKRGEFSDGIKNKYIKREQIIDREEFLRCCLAALYRPVQARQRSMENLFAKSEFNQILPDSSNYRKYMFAYKVFQSLSNAYVLSMGIKLYARYAIVCVVSSQFNLDLDLKLYDDFIKQKLEYVISKWNEFEESARNDELNRGRYFKETVDPLTQEKRVDANWQGYYKGRTLLYNLRSFFSF